MLSKAWTASAAVTLLVTAAVFFMGPASADAAVRYSIAYEGPRDADAVQPLLRAELVRGDPDTGSGYGYGYGYGYGEPDDNGTGYGYGYGYGEGPGFEDLPAGDYSVLGFADLNVDLAASPQEPSALGVDEHGNTLFHLSPGETVFVDILVKEDASDVRGIVRSSAGDAIEGAAVTLTDRFGWALHATSAADGTFLVLDAPTGIDHDLLYGVRVTADGFLPYESGLAYNVTRGSFDLGTLVLDPVPAEPDTTAPYVVAYGPTGANVTVGSSISITFSESMDKASVEDALAVQPSLLGDVIARWSGNTTVTLVSDRPLAHATSYHVSLGAGAHDLAGNGLEAPLAWSFTTARLPTAPTILDHFPVGAKVPPGKPIVITFSVPMDRASVEDGIHVSPALYADEKSSWSGNTFTLRGHRAMDHGTTYTVTIDGDVRDAEGDALGEDFTWSFTTAPGLKPAKPVEKIANGNGHGNGNGATSPKPPTPGVPDAPKAPPVKAEKPDAPKADAPKADAPKNDAPKVEPKKPDAPKVVDAPRHTPPPPGDDGKEKAKDKAKGVGGGLKGLPPGQAQKAAMMHGKK